MRAERGQGKACYLGDRFTERKLEFQSQLSHQIKVESIGGEEIITGSFFQSSCVKNKWCAVMLPTTFLPSSFTASTASAVVQCSKQICQKSKSLSLAHSAF